ncbi:hypothetical protein A9798_02570 [Edwardsiella hoshinae]|uniref:Uncharacterized protein n=1 Tax=Edwardsiella hoshinae TaxID=93378 RepID=A0ABM6EGI7_9GAMM|nr:hypothetical protein [Edwardsiella hoshinae]AOV95946.1 hypothetical protein A9798_02570 [Edwardsiella hoshinae]
MGKINIKDLVKLIFLCICIMYLAVALAYLMASIIVYIKIDVFDFYWKEAFSDAFKKGVVGGSILGFGIWVKAKLQEYKNKKGLE